MSQIRIIGVPLDLGASRRGVDMGPSALRIAQLEAKLEALGHEVQDEGNVDVPEREELAGVRTALDLLPTITTVCRELAARTAQAVRDGCMPLVLGGDHSLGAGSVAGVATAFKERGARIGLLWLDAHGDINTPATSPSGNVHGMPVAHLLGHGDPGMVALAAPPPAVRAANTVIVGVRDLDPPERDHAREFGLTIFTMRDIDERGLRDVMREALAIVNDGTAGFHVSCDADWIDPTEAPGVGTPVRGGATYREGHLAMEMVADSGRLVSMDIVEINPVLDEMNRTADLCVGLVTSAFGLRIL
ncbi:MAG: arginase [Gemmatimonadales bacterium]|jgi:arginase|nr:arginase [Gemmatimonadales bacterium]